MDAFERLIACLESCWPVRRYADVGVVIGVSGGADSVALARAIMYQRSLQPDASGFAVLAHFNHGLRGKESELDEQFARDLAVELGCQFVVDRAAVAASNDSPSSSSDEISSSSSDEMSSSSSDEASLRNKRLDFLVSVAKQFGARYIALAHHVDDQVETVLHHLLRGTGPQGLAGISPTRIVADDFVIVRPLLSVDAQTIRQAMIQIDQPWREDASNQDQGYTRNWIRHELIPMIESRFPKGRDSIHRAAQLQRDWADVIDDTAKQWTTNKSIHAQADRDCVIFRRDRKTKSAIVIRAMQLTWNQLGWPQGEMTQSHWKKIYDTFQDDSPTRFDLPGGIQVTADEQSVKLRMRRGLAV